YLSENSVVVRSAKEILSALDENGALDGLPFMPEMLGWCRKLFRVQRWVYKTCVDGDPMRHFPADDVVVLEGLRCDGSGHDGSKRGCRSKPRCAQPTRTSAGIEPVNADLDELRANLEVKPDNHHYFSQSTELRKSTEALRTGEGPRRLRIALSEIRHGELGVLRALRCSLGTSGKRRCELWVVTTGFAASQTHANAISESASGRARARKISSADCSDA